MFNNTSVPTRADIIGLGLTRAQKVQKSFWGGLKTGVVFSPSSVAMIAFQAATAGRGGFVPAVAGQSMALGAGIIFTGIASAGVSLIPGIGPVAAALLGGVLADYGEVMLGTSLARKVRMFTNLNKSVRHLEMGGSYKDSELAQRQRFFAIQDMNASAIPSRRYLGQEALLFHR